MAQTRDEAGPGVYADNADENREADDVEDPKCWPGKQFRSAGPEAMFIRYAISPIEVIGCATFPRELVQSDSTKRAFAAMRAPVRWLAVLGGARS